MFISLLKNIKNNIYHFKDNEYYYGQFKGALNFWKLALFNLMYPGRFLNQFKYGQIKYLNYLKNKKKKSSLSDEILNKKFLELNENGSVTINNFFSEELISNFKNDYKNEILYLKNKNSAKNEYFKNRSLTIKDSLIKLWLDKRVIELIEHYMGKKIYARNYPTLNYSVGKQETSSRLIHKIKNSNVTDVWHVDHSTLISFHIFLEDVERDGTCMEYVKGTNKFLNSNFSISDEIIQKSNLSVAQCYGKKGSINIHCGNVVHRMRPKPNSNRLMLTFGFSAGSNLMLDVNNIARCLSSNFDIDSLNKKSRDLLQGIFPKKMHKGYDFKKDKFNPTSFKGI